MVGKKSRGNRVSLEIVKQCQMDYLAQGRVNIDIINAIEWKIHPLMVLKDIEL